VSEPTLFRPVLWLCNAVLLIVCGLSASHTASAVLEALESPAPVPPPIEIDVAAAAPPTWSEREVILARNLFDTSRFGPAAPPPPPPAEELEETTLPLDLLGTASESGSDAGWAAIWNSESRESRVVTPGDEMGRGAAKVVAVERERVVLSENGVLRELVFDDETERPPAARAPAPAKAVEVAVPAPPAPQAPKQKIRRFLRQRRFDR
jgi:hypothetical protein